MAPNLVRGGSFERVRSNFSSFEIAVHISGWRKIHGVLEKLDRLLVANLIPEKRKSNQIGKPNTAQIKMQLTWRLAQPGGRAHV